MTSSDYTTNSCQNPKFRCSGSKRLIQPNHSHLQSHFTHQWFIPKTDKLAKNNRHHEREYLDHCGQSKTSFYLYFGKKYYVTEPTASSTVIRKESQGPSVGLQRNRDSNMPNCFSNACSNSTEKYSISELSFLLAFEINFTYCIRTCETI